MAVYARGYREYDGGFRSAPPAWILFRAGIGMALRRRGFRWILNLTGFVVLATAGMVYVQVIVQEQVEQVGRGMVRMQLLQLDSIFHGFHSVTMLLSALGAVLVGSGLVADDLRSRGLALYLVRPIRPVDYMLGKALILPALLIPLALLPGLVLWLLVGLWQPPGETWAFLNEHSELAWRVVRFYLVGAAELTGLMLLLSSRTPRRGMVIGLAAAVLFGGPFLQALGRAIQGVVGTLLKSTNLMNNMLVEFTAARREWRFSEPSRGGWSRQRWEAWQPDETIIVAVALTLLVAGMWFTWRRARGVEVDA